MDPPRLSTRLSSLGESAGAVARHRQTQLASLQRELRGDLEWIPLKALRKDRSQRYRTATEFAEDIQNYLASKPLIAGPESPSYRAKKFLRRNKGPVTAVALVLVVLIAGVSVSTWQAVRLRLAQNDIIFQKDQADAQKKIAEIHEQLSRQHLAEGQVHAGDAFAQAGEILQARRNYHDASDNFEKLNLSVLPAATGLMLSYQAYPPSLITYGSARSSSDPMGHTGAVWHVAVSPDEKHISTAGDNTFRIWDLLTGRCEKILRIDDSLARCQVFLSDGKRLVTGSGSGRITVWNLSTGTAIKSWVAHRGDVMSIVAMPDGESVASVGLEDCKVAIWDLASGKERMSYSRPGERESCAVAVSPDGNTLALAELFAV
jgi:hypothetical protein